MASFAEGRRNPGGLGGWDFGCLFLPGGRGRRRRAGSGPIRVAVDPDHALALVPKQRLSVFVNEKPVATLDVEQALQSYDVAFPAATLNPGDNRIRLTFRSAGAVAGGKRAAAAIAAIAIGAARATSPQPAVDLAAELPSSLNVTEVGLGGASRRALAMPANSRLSFYVQVPAQAKLALAYGSRAPSASVAVRVARDGGAALATLYEGPASGRWSEGAWDLTPFAGQAVRLDLCAPGGGVDWAEPRLVVRAAPPAAASQTKFDHIYVWMIDTLRADKVHIFNPKTNVLTPNYDAFAADAARFTWAQVPGTWSLPSQASMLTGVYPRVHKATVHESKISRDVPFVAEQFKKAGFRTAMFSANGYVSAKWGFDRGWDENRNLIRENLPNHAENLWGHSQEVDHARQGQAAVRVPGGNRAACHLQPAQGVSGQVLEQAVHRPHQAGAHWHPARQDQTRNLEGQRHRQGVPRGAAQRGDHTKRYGLRGFHPGFEDRGAL